MSLPHIPQHIGFIVDGNRRWAREHGLSSLQGHTNGLKAALPKVIRACFEVGVKEVSAWGFSTENWKRDQEEVNHLMNLIPAGIDILLPLAHEFKAKSCHIGRKDRIPEKFRQKLEEAEAETLHYTERKINLCLDHGGQDEITRAVQNIVAAEIPADQITPELIGSYTDSHDCAPLDLIVRTGGDMRLSGFLLWLCSYSELHFESCYFPDLTPERVKEIIASFSNRERRFGGTRKA